LLEQGLGAVHPGLLVHADLEVAPDGGGPLALGVAGQVLQHPGDGAGRVLAQLGVAGAGRVLGGVDPGPLAGHDGVPPPVGAHPVGPRGRSPKRRSPSSELVPSRLAPWTETQAHSPAANSPPITVLAASATTRA